VRALTDKDLCKLFKEYNETLFNNSIDKNISIYFKHLWKTDDADGLYLPGVIFIDSHLKSVPKYARMVLIHEMCHAALPESCVDHGMLFQAELVRIFNRGGFDGLL